MSEKQCPQVISMYQQHHWGWPGKESPEMQIPGSWRDDDDVRESNELRDVPKHSPARQAAIKEMQQAQHIQQTRSVPSASFFKHQAKQAAADAKTEQSKKGSPAAQKAFEAAQAKKAKAEVCFERCFLQGV
jgi:hypothetical protein